MLTARLTTRLADHKAARRDRHHRLRSLARQTRTRIDGRDVVAFCSNDYLGLADDPRLVTALEEGGRRFGVGSGGSHLISGHTDAHRRLENTLCELTGRSAVRLFSSGYQANLATIAAFSERGDTVLHDRLNHASLLDGARLSGARVTRYRHGDIDHLTHCLARDRPLLTVTDSVFSMEGDCAPLSALARHCSAHDSALMVDEAHAFGVIGDYGQGAVAEAGLTESDVAIVTGTLGKAFGTQGAFVAGSETVIEALTQFARPYIFTTGLSPALAWASCEAITIARTERERRTHLSDLIAHFKRELPATLQARLLPSETPIQSLVIGDEADALAVGDALWEQGLLVGVIRPPTVPKGSARLRITLSSAHRHEDVSRLIEVLSQCGVQKTCTEASV
ncbi:8-amino-7-oxononanoate synthase [Larsenimonas salina]|uniref:8-amino-7-oxononanoate synthase n=1 Tax=Larsenimonas salina TaxID=1295565 RepID=UPI00207324DA|nr:8-amino-7-oxononanoate synthase [Larsenimonas salina]MCM5703581.1 8-amino-7-oxononanoate synthase [Larsenimonas salina]